MGHTVKNGKAYASYQKYRRGLKRGLAHVVLAFDPIRTRASRIAYPDASARLLVWDRPRMSTMYQESRCSCWETLPRATKVWDAIRSLRLSGITH